MGLNAQSGTFAALTNVRSKTHVPGKIMSHPPCSSTPPPASIFAPAPATPDQYLTTILTPCLSMMPCAFTPCSPCSHRPL